MATALDADMAVINDDGTRNYVDNDEDLVEVNPAPAAEEAPATKAADARSALFG